MLNVSFRDNSEAIKELLTRKVQAATRAAAVALSDAYRELLDTPAPPHSPPGAIPHSYFGYREDGYGPVNDNTWKNNTTKQGFSGDQRNILSSYIQAAAAKSGAGAVVGFEPSHVTTRQQNYLLGWDQGTIPGRDEKRPWVKEIYRYSEFKMQQEAAVAFKEAQ